MAAAVKRSFRVLARRPRYTLIRVRAGRREDFYEVRRVLAWSGFESVAFEKLTGDKSVSRLKVGPGVAVCSCKGRKYRGVCRHLIICRRLIAAKAMPPEFGE